VEKVLKGDIIYPGTAKGEPVIIDELTNDVNPDEIKGKIGIIKRLSMEHAHFISHLKGAVSIGGSLLSHIAIMAREYGVPAVRVGEDVDPNLFREFEIVEIKQDIVVLGGR